MSARSLVVGLDGADLGVIEALGPRRLPQLHRLMARGAFAALDTVPPPATLPNWVTFWTGVDPGKHGVFDFTMREGYGVRFAGGTVRAVPTVLSRLDALGLVCASFGFPGTWPPEPLEHGVFVSGWDSPVAFEADRSFVHPPSLYDDLRRRFGPIQFDTVDEFQAAAPGWHARLADGLVERIAHRTEVGRWLLESRSWDLFALYFGESDTAAHHLWSLWDTRSPRHPPQTDLVTRDGLARVYEALDRALAALMASAGRDVEVTVVSDHGSGGSSDKVLYLNRVLEEAGLLRFRRPRRLSATALTSLAKQAALTRLPPRLRERVFRAGGGLLPGFVESRARFGAIDMQRTVAFSDELNYFPAIHLNVRGREPQGCLRERDRERAIRDIEAALLAVRDPWSGQPVVAEVLPRRACYRGPLVDRAPDVLLRLRLDGDYSYNVMPSGGAPAMTGPWRKLDEDEWLGRKGRSLPGSHRERGFYVAAGPRVAPVGRIEASMPDATATVLARMGVRIPDDFDGHVLEGVVCSPVSGRMGGKGRRLPPGGEPARKHSPADEARVEARLRSLGYVDG